MFAGLSDARKGGAKDGGGMEIITGVERRRRWRAEDKSRVLAKAAVEHAVAAGEATADVGGRLGTKTMGEAIAKRVREAAIPARYAIPRREAGPSPQTTERPTQKQLRNQECSVVISSAPGSPCPP